MSDASETDKALLMESPPRSAFGRFPSISSIPEGDMYGLMDGQSTPKFYPQFRLNSLDSVPLNTDRLFSHERLADLAVMPTPSPSPPPVANKLPKPTLLSIPNQPQKRVNLNTDPTIIPDPDLIHRPSYLKPRRAAPLPPALRSGPSRRGRPDMRGALLTRMATKRSRSQGDPTEDDSPVSIYSQRSLRRGDTYKFFPKSNRAGADVPPVPPMPQPFSSFSNDAVFSPTDLERSQSFSGMPSPSRHMFARSPTEGQEKDVTSPSFLQRRLFNDDTALPEASMVSDSRWWSNVWGSYVPTSPTSLSAMQATVGSVDSPNSRRSISSRMSMNTKTKDASWFHATPEYGIIEEDYGEADAERGQVMIATWSPGLGNSAQKVVEREARRLPAAPTAGSPNDSAIVRE